MLPFLMVQYPVSMKSTNQNHIDQQFMRMALVQAHKAVAMDEVPVGAVLVHDAEVLATGSNRCSIDNDPSAHAEVVALRSAAGALQNFRLDGATLYVTIEPCLMCCGALLQARIARLVYGAREPRTGAVVSVHESLRIPGVGHHVAITEGVLADESASLMQAFFYAKR